tara:strand:- start:1251 stop:1589 length:339 start_codon:yes stop_codon:yes gene_type:complete
MNRRAVDNMNPVSKAATNYAGIIIPIIATILIAISGAVIKIYSDVQIGKNVYATSKDVNQKIVKFTTYQGETTDKKFDSLQIKLDALTIHMQEMAILMARMEEKINAIHSRE